MNRSLPQPPSRRALRAVAVVSVLLAATAAAAHLGFLAERSRARDRTAPLERRLAAARSALRIEPWRDEARAYEGFLRGAVLLRGGDYNRAVDVLAEAYRLDVGNREILAEFRRAQRIQSEETVKKAHLQHGHEGPGGVLRPDQIER